MGLRAAVVLLAFGFLCVPASAGPEWEVVRLGPAGGQDSFVYAVSGGLQAGWADVGNMRPALWSGSAESYVDLTPSGAFGGDVFGMDGNRQVGSATFVPSRPHAAMWQGSAGSFIDLHPPSRLASIAYGIRDEQQVGYAADPVTGRAHAALWRGDADSYVDLRPAGSEGSIAYASDGTLQGGETTFPNQSFHAALWASTAASFVDLNPHGAVRSQVRGMAPGVQVGIAEWMNTGSRAVLWRGSAESYIDLTPVDLGARSGRLSATVGYAHAGAAWFNSLPSAGLWLSDDPSSFVNLDDVLGSGWGSSSVFALDELPDGRLVAGGYGFNGQTGYYEAVMWVQVPAPGAGAILAVTLLAALRRRRC